MVKTVVQAIDEITELIKNGEWSGGGSGGGESGGSDSDLSIAVCTLIVTSGSSAQFTRINGVYLDDDAPSGDAYNVEGGDARPYNAIMYRGVSNISIASSDVVTASGDIDLVDDGYEENVHYYNATVHGDCTINCIGASIT